MRSALILAAAIAAMSACAPSGYHYEVGSFTPTPTRSQGFTYSNGEPVQPTKVIDRPPAPASSSPAPIAKSTPIEKKAVLFKSEKEDLALIEDLSMLVRVNGYRCDSISAARPMITSYGFVLVCNEFRYTYDIQDKGGHWVINVR